MGELLDSLGHSEGLVAYVALGLCAMLEYVFPPFPGDTVTLFGAFLVVARGWNAAAVLGAVTAGSVVGAAVDYSIGVSLARDRPASWWLPRWWARMRPRTEPLVDQLRRRGAAYLVVNRFLPGIRAFFFVAAGMAGLRLRAVLLYATISALAGNLLLVAAGVALGASWERLRGAASVYSAAVWTLIGLVVLALACRWLLRRRRRARAGEGGPGARRPT